MSETQESNAQNNTDGGQATDTTLMGGKPAEATKEASQEQQPTGEKPEAKAEGDKQEDADATKATEKVVPEKYEFKAPEGFEFNEQILGKFSEVAKELKLSQDEAQKVAEVMAPAIAAQQQEALTAARTEWETSAKTDKEYGGEKLTENLATAKKALDQFGSPELKSLLEQSGLGSHPEVVRFFFRAGKAISEDKLVTGDKSGEELSLADKLYGKTA